MTDADARRPWPHEDPAFFREAVSFTAAETGFATRLIEKDYFCTLLLERVTRAEPSLVFKGGTCLAKVHAGFYRLSEDLDLVVPTPVEAPRAERRRRAAGPSAAIAAAGRGGDLHLVSGPTGANRSTQYAAVLGYSSLLDARAETIKIEVGLREPVLTNVQDGAAETLLLDPISGSRLVPPLSLPCLSREEAMAEKLRAALSRREVAIRDFFDVDHAVRRLRFDALDERIVALVRAKLGVPGNEAVDVSAGRLATLRNQLTSQLKPVLRSHDFAEFDLERAFGTVSAVATALGETAGPD